ncbi:hypothetical protein P153DRAFT_339343 [Dothidotthia symphoricarpi CBS 119687]|uniref:BTB domain-containing protein n=1 Tax=Dothidotthia symphoricarpi CBS 119687 TaxID=1392245 RepID=A0A6A6AGB4_9PLEO|nr:uncharacterized protein P153DRAFT_339343 [Dothidotthia symphoricarpi CBS 119687]KAF2129974.1 hypothetical protein P153DRAFT_339343 [Dothidotthia symphoricarpi CBS 119687]
MTRIPTNLPPPYTWSGARSGQLRTSPTDLTTTTTLLIGPKPTPFHIHTLLLTASSPYFRAALTGPFLESRQNSITLPDIPVPHFQLLATWLYTSTLAPPFKDGKPAYYTLLHVYALADRLCMEGLRNAVVDALCDVADATNSVPTPTDTRILYDGIRDSARVRELVLDLFAFKKTGRLLERHEEEWDAGFLRDLVVRLKSPVKQALVRHRLGMWWPASWGVTRACEGCRVVLVPRVGAVACEECCVAFCGGCVEVGVGMAGWDGARRKGEGVGGKTWEACKPWRGARCVLYHEHRETERCGDVFMGR